jgi:hypothetical protein
MEAASATEEVLSADKSRRDITGVKIEGKKKKEKKKNQKCLFLFE